MNSIPTIHSHRVQRTHFLPLMPHVAYALIAGNPFEPDPKFVESMRKRFRRIQHRPEQFVPTRSQKFGEHRCSEKECKIFSGAYLSSVTKVIKMIICLCLQPLFGCETISERLSLGIAMQKIIQDDHLRFLLNGHAGELVIRQHQAREHCRRRPKPHRVLQASPKIL